MSMDTDIPLLLSLVFMVGGLVALAKSADVFISSASALSRHFGLSPLIVGMVVIGFGTSAPELAVSAMSGMGGHSNLSLGNAYGSCVFNIGAILGVTAIIWPIKVKASVNWFAVPLLVLITALSWFVLSDGMFERSNGVALLLIFAVLLPLYCWYDQRDQVAVKPAAANVAAETSPVKPLKESVRLVAGFAFLVASSHLLVWGSVDFARDILHVSDLLIGLTIVAAGTSLPELASAIASAHRGENEFVLGNIVGSNFFNTLAVVGLAGTISPFSGFSSYVMSRDLPMMMAMSVTIAIFGVNFRDPRKPGCISRWKGVIWVLSFLAYLTVIILQELHGEKAI